jgi:hypothetical protein
MSWNPPLFIDVRKRHIFSLMVPNLGLWFSLKGSQLLVQSDHHELSKLL